MLRRFLRDSALYSFSAALSRGIAIVLIPLYTRFLTTADYGALDLLTVFATLSNYIITLEISQGLARLYADARSAQEKDAYVSTAWWFAATSYAVFTVLFIAFSDPIAERLLGSVQWGVAVRAMAVAIGLNGTFFVMQDLMRWKLRPVQHALASIGYALISGGLGALLVVYAHLGVVGILYAQSAGALAGIAFLLVNGSARYWRAVFRTEDWLTMIAYSAPQVVSSVAGYASLYLDRLLIKHLLSIDEVGTYGVAARLASVVALLMMGFQSGLVPLLFQQYQSPDSPRQLARVFRYFLVLAAALLLFLAGFSKELLWIFTTPAYYGTWQVIPLLGTALLLANMYIFVPGIFLARRTGIAAMINVGALIVNLAFNMVLIPAFGITGAAAASVLSSGLAFAAYAYYNQIHYPISLNGRGCAFAAVLLVGFALAAAALQSTADPGSAVLPRLLLCGLGLAACTWFVLGGAEIRLAMQRLVK